MGTNTILYVIVSALIGFILKTLHGKIFERKVNLYHQLDNPAVFSHIPPQVSFQNLKIGNLGNLPGNNLRVNLRENVIQEYDVTYKPVTEEPWTEERREGVLTLKFDRILPKDEWLISFKSSHSLPQDFLLSIKSDEMISVKMPSKTATKKEQVMNQIGAFIAGALIALFVASIFWPKTGIVTRDMSALNPVDLLSVSLKTDKNIYRKGEKVQLFYQLKNESKELLRDVTGFLEVPGFELDFEQRRTKRNFFEPNATVSHKVTLVIPQDAPTGMHKVYLRVAGDLSGDTRIFNESRTEFEVR